MKTDPIFKKIDAGIKKAVADALLKHKKLGQSIAVWEKGKVVIIPPNKIKIKTPKKP